MNDWNFSGELTPDQWSLVHQHGQVVYFGQEPVSTTSTLFVGTREECDAEIERLGLTWQPPEGTTAVLASEVDFESLPPKPEL